MTATAIFSEIKKLPFNDKLLLVEKTLKTIRHVKEHHLEHAVNTLYNDYVTDKELTLFTNLDFESFYETK